MFIFIVFETGAAVSNTMPKLSVVTFPALSVTVTVASAVPVQLLKSMPSNVHCPSVPLLVGVIVAAEPSILRLTVSTPISSVAIPETVNVFPVLFT